MECYEKGLISNEDTEGVELKWGNYKVLVSLVEKIAKREGIGDLLAEGVRISSLKVGKGAEKFALHIKGLELPMHEPRVRKGDAVLFATSNRGACHLQGPIQIEHESMLAPEIGIDKTFLPYLNRLYLGPEKVKLIKIGQDLYALYDSLIVCKLTAYVGGISINTLFDIVASVTGWDIASEELMTIGERNFNLCRAFNVREGITRNDDYIPARLMELPLPDGFYKSEVIKKDTFQKALDYYYEFRGWDVRTGVPTRNKLEELELKYVVDVLQKMGKLIHVEAE